MKNIDSRFTKIWERKVEVAYTKSELKGMFKRSDNNKDGNLSWNELIKAFSSLDSSIPLFRALQALWQADSNRDGCISEVELENLVTYVWEQHYTIK